MMIRNSICTVSDIIPVTAERLTVKKCVAEMKQFALFSSLLDYQASEKQAAGRLGGRGAQCESFTLWLIVAWIPSECNIRVLFFIL